MCRVDGWELYRQGYVLVIPTNRTTNKEGCAVMGAGLAKQASQMFSDLSMRYGQALRAGDSKVFFAGLRLICVPTKEHWSEPAQIGLVAAACDFIKATAKDYPALQFAVPRLGCGLGKLDWNVVKPMMKAVFMGCDNIIILDDSEEIQGNTTENVGNIDTLLDPDDYVSASLFQEYQVDTGNFWMKREPDCVGMAISFTIPNGMKMMKVRDLAPPWGIVNDYRNQVINEKQYEVLYLAYLKSSLKKYEGNTIQEKLASLLVKAFELAGTKHIALLCYEKEGNFCHRRIIFNLLPEAIKGVMK